MFSCVCNKQNIVTRVVSSWLNLQDIAADCHLKLEPGSAIPGPVDDRWSTAEMVTGRGNSSARTELRHWHWDYHRPGTK